MKNLKNVFISHVHEDDDRLPALKQLLAKHGLDVRDSSINSDKPNRANNEEYIKREILAPRIDWAGVLLVLVTPDTCKSDYVNWEIEYASKTDTRIVTVLDWGESDADLPEAAKDCSNAIVSWRGDDIVRAIDGENIFCNSDGSPRDPIEMPKYNC